MTIATMAYEVRVPSFSNYKHQWKRLGIILTTVSESLPHGRIKSKYLFIYLTKSNPHVTLVGIFLDWNYFYSCSCSHACLVNVNMQWHLVNNRNTGNIDTVKVSLVESNAWIWIKKKLLGQETKWGKRWVMGWFPL